MTEAGLGPGISDRGSGLSWGATPEPVTGELVKPEDGREREEYILSLSFVLFTSCYVGTCYRGCPEPVTGVGLNPGNLLPGLGACCRFQPRNLLPRLALRFLQPRNLLPGFCFCLLA